MDKALSKRYTGPDFLKFVCAFLVVGIHTCSILGASKAGYMLFLPITRVAVPLFFMISGFFYAGLTERQKLRQLKKLLFLTLFSLCLFLCFELLRTAAKGEAAAAYFEKFCTGAYWLNFLLFNDPDISMHLWYLCAMFYVLLILYFAGKYMDIGRLYVLIPVLLLGNFVLGTYASAVFCWYLHIHFSRNFLFCALPFFLLGHYVRSRRPQVSNRLLIVVLLLSVLGSVAENYVIVSRCRDFNLDLFICTPIFALSAFLLVLQNEPLFEKKLLRSAAELGRKTSTAVFIMHPMVIILLSDMLPALSSAGGLVTVPLVFILCVGIALLIEKINQTRRLK